MIRPSVCLATLCSQADREILPFALELMDRPWISRVVVLFTDEDRSTYNEGKVEYHSQNFGSGWHRAPANGGFDEVRARLVLRTIAKELADWVLFWTPDEVFRDSAYLEICRAHAAKQHCVWFSWFNPVTPDLQITFRETRIHVNGIGPLMQQPHPVAVISHSGLHYVPMPRSIGLPNQTLHCQLNTWDLPYTHQHRAPGVHHLHFAYLLSPKRETHPQPGNAGDGYWLELFDRQFLPPRLIDEWNKQGRRGPRWGGRNLRAIQQEEEQCDPGKS